VSERMNEWFSLLCGQQCGGWELDSSLEQRSAVKQKERAHTRVVTCLDQGDSVADSAGHGRGWATSRDAGALPTGPVAPATGRTLYHARVERSKATLREVAVHLRWWSPLANRESRVASRPREEGAQASVLARTGPRSRRRGCRVAFGECHQGLRLPWRSARRTVLEAHSISDAPSTVLSHDVNSPRAHHGPASARHPVRGARPGTDQRPTWDGAVQPADTGPGGQRRSANPAAAPDRRKQPSASSAPRGRARPEVLLARLSLSLSHLLH
jgi:hypothetical protein